MKCVNNKHIIFVGRKIRNELLMIVVIVELKKNYKLYQTTAT